MSITITDQRMTSDVSKHHAWCLDVDQARWEVSWLPGHHLDRHQATTAMALAEIVATRTADDGLHHDDPAWALIDSWARELELTGPAAVTRLGV